MNFLPISIDNKFLFLFLSSSFSASALVRLSLADLAEVGY